MKVKIKDHKIERGRYYIKTENGWINIKRPEVFKKMIERGYTNHRAGLSCKKYKEQANGKRLYNIWNGMRSRCSKFSKKKSSIKHYYGRGIRVCQDWEDYEKFEDWANKNGYKDNLTIERINVDGNYCPENCKWIIPSKQARNTKRNVKITINGVTKILDDWAKIYGIKPNTATTRIVKYGWCPIKAVTTPLVIKEAYSGRFKKYEAFGKEKTLKGWAEESGLPASLISQRINKYGWLPERAITTQMAN